MRGKLPHEWWSWLFGRIIPAHAGQTDSEIPSISAASGSSPRMRGKRLRHLVGDKPFRIIPAHAGQTRRPGPRVARCPDHPRACGANKCSLVFNEPEYGSSPRMRGKLIPATALLFHHRIIPAHAGQTWSRRRRCCWLADHPRACGANPPKR